MLDFVGEIWSNVRQHKLRTLLTGLSIAWGIFMLVILLGAGKGLENGAAYEFRDDAINSIWVWAGKTSVPFAGRGPGRSIVLVNEDYSALAQKIPGIDHITGRYNLSGQYSVRLGSRSAAFNVLGVHPGHQYTEKTDIIAGRFLNDGDLEERRKVAVIGLEVQKFLFPNLDALGKYIEIGALAYKVVGVFQDVGGEAEMRRIYVPVTTAQLVYSSAKQLHQIIYTMGNASVEASKAMQAQTTEILAARHAVSEQDTRALRVRNSLEQFAKIQQIFNWISAFIWIVGIGTLLAGIVGVSNIMLISVRERTVEIGVRKALGATPFSVVRLVLAEALAITGVSGYVGLVCGILAVEVSTTILPPSAFMRYPSVDVRVALAATLLMVVAGALSGLFPAIHAARISPIAALRSE